MSGKTDKKRGTPFQGYLDVLKNGQKRGTPFQGYLDVLKKRTKREEIWQKK
jgi:predicted RNA-binding protein associated with RNAse of E/G family